MKGVPGARHLHANSGLEMLLELTSTLKEPKLCSLILYASTRGSSSNYA